MNDNLHCPHCGSSGVGEGGVMPCPYRDRHNGVTLNWKTVEFYLKWDKPIGEEGSKLDV